MALRSVLFVTILAFAPGCGLLELGGLGPETLFGGDEGFVSTRIALTEASLAGDFESARNVDTEVRGELTVEEFEDSDDCPAWSTATLVGTVPGGAVMQGFSMEASPYDDRFAPGAHVEFSMEEEWTENTLWIDAYACSGPEEGEWEYDEPAESVVVDVAEHPALEGARVFTVTGHYGNGETLVGEFTVPPPAASTTTMPETEHRHE